MDPITHGISSWVISRAGANRLAARAILILVVAGVLPDLDYLTFFGSPSFYLRFHHALTHSLLSGAILIALLAVAFHAWELRRYRAAAALQTAAQTAADARRATRPIPPPDGFIPVLLLCAIAVVVHLLLDLCGADGVRLLWPFSGRAFSADWLPPIDPVIQLLLLAGVALPSLVRLVSEEIGERRRGLPPVRGAVIALVAVAAWIGFRADYHSRAIALILSHDYHGNVPVIAGAFPAGNSPFDWRGVASTADTIEVIDVPLGPGDVFRPENSLSEFKPGASPALAAARETPASLLFLAVARFPIATIEHTDTGARFTMRDLRFPEGSADPANVQVVVNLNFENQAVTQEIIRTSSLLSGF